LSANETFFEDLDVCGGHTYTYNVGIIIGGVDQELYSSASVEVPASHVSDLRADLISSDSVTLSWNVNYWEPCEARDYYIERTGESRQDDMDGIFSKNTGDITCSAGRSTFVDTGLRSGSTYSYRVSSCDDCGGAEDAPILTLTTP
jgi:hypothetical protein